VKKEFHEADYDPRVCCSYYVCCNERYPIHQLHSHFQQATGTRRVRLDRETDSSLCPFSSLVQFSKQAHSRLVYSSLA
jgi:hypothetical protein